MAADAENEIQKSAQLIELENLKNVEQNELNRETELFVMDPELVPINKKDMTDEKFQKWKLSSREFENGKDGRSVNKNLYQKSLICYFYKEKVDKNFRYRLILY